MICEYQQHSWIVAVTLLSSYQCYSSDIGLSSDLVFDYEDALEVFEGLHDAMSENGVLVAAMGDAPTRESPAIDTEIAKGFSEVLVQAGFESVRDYEEVRVDAMFSMHYLRRVLSFFLCYRDI